MDFYRLYRVFKWTRRFFLAVLFIVGGSVAIIMMTVLMIRDEMRFHRLYGNNWVQMYEKYEEPLSRTNLKIGMGICFVIGMVGFLFWLYRRYASKQARDHHHRRRRH
jgi:hypothetical protein